MFKVFQRVPECHLGKKAECDILSTTLHRAQQLDRQPSHYIPPGMEGVLLWKQLLLLSLSCTSGCTYAFVKFTAENHLSLLQRPGVINCSHE